MFILNSFFEGLPNVLVEAIQYKIPIISTNCLSGPEEILENGKYGSLVNVKDYKDLAKKIENNINDYNSALTKASKGHASLTRFSADKQCQKYLDIIRTL
jgi:glycosyltransferase involved in cell wall biosynthesis